MPTSLETNRQPHHDHHDFRDSWMALWRGFAGRCPHCGNGKLYRAFLKVSDSCAVCGEELHHQRADDAPPYFVIMIVGHIIVPLVMMVEAAFAPPLWLHSALWAPMIVVLSIALLPRVKGAIVGWQWAHRMHGFDPAWSDDPLPIPAEVPERRR